MKLGYQPPEAGTIRGVLLATEQSGNDTVTVPMEIAADFSGAGGARAKAVRASRRCARRSRPRAFAAPVLLLFAILGGLILNLMPCVFPVLSIKAIGLVEQAKKHPAAVRAKGLVFAAGRHQSRCYASRPCCWSFVPAGSRSAGASSCNRRCSSPCWYTCCWPWA